MNHNVFFRKLIMDIQVKYLFLEYRYKGEQYYVRWNGIYFQPVLQLVMELDYGVYFLLFCLIYTDKLSGFLNNSDFGCNINDQTMKHLLYVDNCVLLNPRVRDLADIL